MIKLQDFAAQQGVTDRAIQKHLKNHEEALQGHFERKGPNGTWLDDYACEFIRSKMVQQPLVMADSSLVQKVADLEREKADLNAELKDVYKLNAELYRQLGDVKDFQLRLEAFNEERGQLTEAVQKAALKASEDAQTLKEKDELIETLRKQLEASENRCKASDEELNEVEELGFFGWLRWKHNR